MCCSSDLLCRHCQQPLNSFEQPITPVRVNGEWQYTETLTVVDCRDRACPLYGVTLSLTKYFTVDLQPYIERVRG